jgi:hypothetical protein
MQIRHPESPPSLSRRQNKLIANRLAILGFNSYRDYLHSDHWKSLRADYCASGLPQYCYVCHDWNFDLHHKTYKRIGCEKLTDLIALCRLHHELTHKLDQDWRHESADPSKFNLWTAARQLRERELKERKLRPRRRLPKTLSSVASVPFQG